MGERACLVYLVKPAQIFFFSKSWKILCCRLSLFGTTRCRVVYVPLDQVKHVNTITLIIQPFIAIKSICVLSGQPQYCTMFSWEPYLMTYTEPSLKLYTISLCFRVISTFQDCLSTRFFSIMEKRAHLALCLWLSLSLCYIAVIHQLAYALILDFPLLPGEHHNFRSLFSLCPQACPPPWRFCHSDLLHCRWHSHLMWFY